MSFMKQDLGMSKERELSDIVLDENGEIADWVCEKLGFAKNGLGDNLTFGFVHNGKIIGGLVFSDYEQKHNVWWTIYTTDKRWCTKNVLKDMFALAFRHLECKRISLLVNEDNQTCLDFVLKLGFQKEGLLKKYRYTGENCYILGLLKQNCKWS